jgi:protein TonB
MVVDAGVSADVYAVHLVDIARACRGGATLVPALPATGPSTLERRIVMLLNTTRNRRLPSRWAVLTLLMAMLAFGSALSSVGLFAQTASGTLSGRVYDTSGGVLPGVEVVLEDAQKVAWPTVTDATGRFDFASIGAGKYTLSVTVPGFRTLRDQFDLREAKDWQRSVTMQVGELEETIRVTARRPAQPPPASAVTSPAPVRVGGNIKPPQKLVNVPPAYPASMRNAGLEGLVPMEALIAADGSVSSVRVLSAQVHPAFARAAEDAVRQWRFSQTLLNGVPVEVRMAVSVSFGLTD